MKTLPCYKTVGGFLLILSMVGVVHSARTCVAQKIYLDSKYGTEATDPDRVIENCRRAFRLYPFNYRFCLLASESAYAMALSMTGRSAEERMAISRLWCERGLALNPYQMELRWLKAQILWKESPERGIRHWRTYVDWDFWSASNHAILAEMYARNGDIENAEKEIFWTQGSEYFVRVQEAIATAKRSLSPMSN